MSAGLQDSRGCLTDAGLRTLQAAPLGQAPPALAEHLARCPRCQQRLLSADAGAGRAHRRPKPPAWRLPLVVALAALACLIALVMARRWSARPRPEGRGHSPPVAAAAPRGPGEPARAARTPGVSAGSPRPRSS